MTEYNKKASEEALNKASYYYAQALLIFVYLIPDNDKQETESNELKISCHLNQSLCFLKLKRYENALTEVDQVLSRLDKSNTKALYRKAQILEAVGRYEEALEQISSYFAKGLVGDDQNAKSFNQLKT